MTKQKIKFLKTQNFLRTYPNILFFQHNNLSVSEWFHLRTQLKTMENVNLFLLKNTLIDNVLVQENILNPSLFQGPCFALGFSESSQIPNIIKITRQEPPILLIGGLFENQFLNHLDIAKLQEIDSRIHETFLINLSQSPHLHGILPNSLKSPLNQLDQVSWNLLKCLEILKMKHQGGIIVYI